MPMPMLPLPTEPAKTTEEPELVLLAEHLADSPVTAQDLGRGQDVTRNSRKSFITYRKGGLTRVTLISSRISHFEDKL